jgi:hypothetical protein
MMLIVMVLSVVATAQVPKTIADPLFGILYDPDRVRFQQLPSVVSKTCTNVRKRYVAGWVYADLQTADARYLLVSGLIRSRDEETGADTVAQEEGDGTIIVLRKSKCLMDQADYFFSQSVNPAKDATPIMVSRSIIVGLLRNGFERYSNAFGGAKKFLAKVRIDVIAPPIVREQLEIFEKHHHVRK